MLTPLSRRRPWQVARQASTVDRLSGGRLVFGAGLGFNADDFTPFGEQWDPRVRAQRLDEALDVVTGLWAGGPFSYAGAHYQLDEVTIGPAPVQRPRIPVWVAAGWPHRRPLTRAARWDGVYLMTVHQRTREQLSPSDVAEVVAVIRALRGGERDEFDVAFNAVQSDDPATTTSRVRDFADAGGTWWIELAPGSAEDGPDQYRERIRRGPPAATQP
jgi:alkanesulfonate monooxygenase SsuD/methylene tetrahydromethanopterin reductase-like flavin-dependent oxidoreductase (luciferase family)